MRRVAPVLVIVATLAAGCSGGADEKAASQRVRATPSPTEKPKPPPRPTPSARPRPAAAKPLQAFANCAEFGQHLRREAIRRVLPWGLSGAGSVTASAGGSVAMAGAAGAPAGGRAVPASPIEVDHSKTNVQEEGVDEPDIVETDGWRIFSVTDGRTLRSVVVDKGKPKPADTLVLPGSGFQLLLTGNRLLAIGNEYARGRPKTIVMVIDVSDAAVLRVASRVHLDGSYVSARSVGGIARVVTRHSSPPIKFTSPKRWTKAGKLAALQKNQALLAKTPASAWLPRFKIEDHTLPNRVKEGVLAPCERSYRPASFSGFGAVTVTTIDPGDPEPAHGTSVVGGGEIVYASKGSLYVTTEKLPRPASLSDRLRGEVDGTVRDATPLTAVHKFDIEDPHQTRYLASGTITGTLLNQFSMSEHEGYLRVASTIAAVRAGRVRAGLSNSVIVFEQQGEKLVEAGRVDGLGLGERIFAVRFMGPVGYVVTFRRIDPLYAVDLSDPRHPRVGGELKIPGYSAYLHPVANGLLLGIGQDATSTGFVKGTQLSLFDVSDISAPKRLHKLTVGGGESETEWDHHAFLWWAPRKIAVVPLWQWDSKTGKEFNGAIALDVDRLQGIEDAGRITHPRMSRSRRGAETIRRSLVIGDALYTVSDRGVMSNDLRTLEQRTWGPF